MPALDLDLQVGLRLNELLIERVDSVAARVFAPGLIVIPCGIAECAQNPFKIVPVLKANVFLDDCNAGRTSIFGASARVDTLAIFTSTRGQRIRRFRRTYYQCIESHIASRNCLTSL